MRAFVFDYECYFDRASKYTLEHMNPAEYILDARFEVTGLAVKELGCPDAVDRGSRCRGFSCEPRSRRHHDASRTMRCSMRQFHPIATGSSPN